MNKTKEGAVVSARSFNGLIITMVIFSIILFSVCALGYVYHTNTLKWASERVADSYEQGRKDATKEIKEAFITAAREGRVMKTLVSEKTAAVYSAQQERVFEAYGTLFIAMEFSNEELAQSEKGWEITSPINFIGDSDDTKIRKTAP
ncbi:MAG: hypothetical protein HGA67_00170 [Candidatus Yonathbacteria bacterium]|nr:hypothetical protein [Candidatus Yonathbacteria bacterium]